MRKLLILLLAAGLFIACNNDQRLRDSDKDRKEKVDERDKDDRRADDKERSDANGYEDRSKDESKDDYSSSGWTRDDEDKFMYDCETEARKNVTASRAKEYCGCMLVKIEKLYSTMDAANRNMTETEMNTLAAECNSGQ